MGWDQSEGIVSDVGVLQVEPDKLEWYQNIEAIIVSSYAPMKEVA
jgi:hypothetical protein